METIKFLIQGSATDPYEVLFKKRGDNNLSAYCTCPAGDNGMYCKHRIRILSGDSMGIVSNNRADIVTVVEWLKGTDVERALQEIVQLELKFNEIKSELSNAKKILAKSMLD